MYLCAKDSVAQESPLEAKGYPQRAAAQAKALMVLAGLDATSAKHHLHRHSPARTSHVCRW
jgi:hypothetical protein